MSATCFALVASSGCLSSLILKFSSAKINKKGRHIVRLYHISPRALVAASKNVGTCLKNGIIRYVSLWFLSGPRFFSGSAFTISIPYWFYSALVHNLAL